MFTMIFSWQFIIISYKIDQILSSRLFGFDIDKVLPLLSSNSTIQNIYVNKY